MIPKISLISHSVSPENDPSLRWLLAQESPAVQVIILHGPSATFSDSLAQALPHVQGELFCWMEPGSEFQIPDWLPHLYEVWCGAEVDLLGIRGMADITLHTLHAYQGEEAVQLSRVIGGSRVNVVGAHPLSVESVLALGPGMVMGSVQRLLPWMAGLGTLLKPDNVMTFSLLSRLFAGLRLGVVQGFPILERQPLQAWATFEQLRGVAGFLPLNLSGFDSWSRNLAALNEVQPDTVTWLAEASVKTRWSRFDSRACGRLMLRGGDLDAIVVDVFMQAQPGDTWWVLGAGAGGALDQVMKIPNTRVEVLEPEAALLCHLLSRFDWSNAIRQGRMRFHDWDTQHPLWKQISARKLLSAFQTVLEETDRPAYFTSGGSYYLNENALKEVEKTLHRLWFRLREGSQWKANRKLIYDVTVVSPQCAIFKDLATCFHQMGYRTRLLNVSDGKVPITWQKSSQQILDLLKNGSDLTVFRNRSLLESENWQDPTSIAPDAKDQWVSWWWDVPNISSMLEQTVPSQATPALGFAKAMLNSLPYGSDWLPAGARMPFCMPEPATEDYHYPLSFVGQSRWNHIRTQLAILRALMPDYMSSGATLSEEWRWKGSAIELLTQLEEDSPWVDQVILRLGEASPAKGYYLDYVWRMAYSGTFRMAAIELLILENLPVTVFGDAEWLTSGIVTEKHFAGVIAPKDLPVLYRNSKINLNLNFMQVSSTVNPKVLDISACNGFVLTDFREEVNDLFPLANSRPVTFQSLEELPALVDKLLQEDTRVMAARSGEWVRSRHTMQHRAAWLADRYKLRNLY